MKPDDIIEFIIKRGGECTFAEFVQFMKGTRGSMDLFVPNTNKKVYVWTGLSFEFVKALEELRASGRIEFERCERGVYSKVMKLSLSLPIAQKGGMHIQDCWLPCIVKLKQKKEISNENNESKIQHG